MFAGRSAEHQLRSWMERPGNWRLKGMLSAALPESSYTHEEMGEAFYSLAQQPEVKEHHLSQRPSERKPPAVREKIRPLSYGGDYAETSHARSLAKNDSKISKKELQNGVDLDKYMGRMLLNESTSEKDVLWREQLLDTIVMGAEEAKVARDAATVLEVNTKKGDHPVRADEIFAGKVAEGAGIPFDEIDFSQQSWNATKFGLGAYITEEVIDHAMVDLIDQNLRWLGAATENALNRVFMNALVDGPDSSNDVETNAGTTAPFGTDLDQLLEARNNIIGGNWPAPDTIVMHDEFQLGMVAGNNDQNLLFSNRAGQYDAKDNGEFPAGLFGLEDAHLVPDGPYNSSSNTWGYAADGEFGAVMYPRDLMYVYMYRDLETKDFEDPIRDLEGANVRGQFDAGVGQSSAFARIKN